MEYTDGSMKFKIRRFGDSGGGGRVLSGTILAFSGTFSADGYPINSSTGQADKTWHLCDGTNGTPDLRGRFILGASASHAKGTTGGEEAHSLTPDENAPHDHSATCSKAGLHSHKINPRVSTSHGSTSPGVEYYNGAERKQGDISTEPAGLHAHDITIGTSGKGTPHNNMPPFYTLSYIMKL